MSLVITGARLPEVGEMLEIHIFCTGGGSIYVYDPNDPRKKPKRAFAKYIPPHGKLVDINDVMAKAHDVILENGAKHRCIDATVLHEIPTILEEWE